MKEIKITSTSKEFDLQEIHCNIFKIANAYNERNKKLIEKHSGKAEIKYPVIFNFKP
jgi:hypothetical protein